MSNHIYGNDGRIRGAYIYMLLCQDDGGPVYVKIGMSSNPTQRLHALRLGCPVTPHQFCTMRHSSSKIALKTERILHKALKQWRSSGEWYRVPVSEQKEFNQALRAALNSYHRSGFPQVWEKVPVQPLVRLAEQRLKDMQRLWNSRGLARRDFLSQSQ